MHQKFWKNIAHTIWLAGIASLLLAFGATGARAQVWQATYHYSGQDMGRGVVLQADNSVVAAGETAVGSANPNVYVVKTNGCHTAVWGYAYDIGGRDQVGKIRPTADGGFVIVGTTENLNSQGCNTRNDIFLMKIDAAGTVLWTRVYGGSNTEEGRDVRVVSNGYVIAGSTTSFGAGSRDGYIIKTDLNGFPVWGKTYGGTGDDFFMSCNIAANNDIVAVGETFSFTSPANGDIYVARVDMAAGNLIAGFPKRYGGTSNDLAWSVLVEPTGQIIIAGSTRSYGGNSEGFLLRLDAAGVPIAMQTYGGAGTGGWDEFLDIAKYNTFYVVTGLFFNAPNGFGNYDMFVGVFDGAFNTISLILHGGTGVDQGWAVATYGTGAQNIVVAGLTASFGFTPEDIYLVRQDVFGYTGGCATAETRVDNLFIELGYTNITVTVTSNVPWCTRTVSQSTNQYNTYTLCSTCMERPSGRISSNGSDVLPGEKFYPPAMDSVAMQVSSVDAPNAETARELKLYPNPLSHERLLTVEYGAATGDMQFTISDMMGKVVSSGQQAAAKGRLDIDARGWPAGTYVLSVVTGDRTRTKTITVLDN